MHELNARPEDCYDMLFMIVGNWAKVHHTCSILEGTPGCVCDFLVWVHRNFRTRHPNVQCFHNSTAVINNNFPIATMQSMRKIKQEVTDSDPDTARFEQSVPETAIVNIERATEANPTATLAQQHERQRESGGAMHPSRQQMVKVLGV